MRPPLPFSRLAFPTPAGSIITGYYIKNTAAAQASDALSAAVFQRRFFVLHLQLMRGAFRCLNALQTIDSP